MRLVARLVLCPVLLTGCPDQALQRFNAEPDAFIMSHQDGSPVVAEVPVEFRGSVSDANHDAGQLTVAWTAGGRAICPPGPPATDGTTTCTAAISAGEELLQLTVRDPDDAATSASLTLQLLAGTPPRAEITAPTTSTRLYSDQPVALVGQVDDDEDSADALVVQWQLDGADIATVSPASDGQVTGSIGPLSEGSHSLGLAVTDSAGEGALDTLTLTVGGPNQLPSCSIDAPDDEASVPEGEAVIFRGSALDPDISAEALLAVWTSNRDGELDRGAPSAGGDLIFSTPLSTGVHTIRLTVTDEVGGACSDQRLLRVSARPTLNVTAPTAGSVWTSEQNVGFAATVSDAEDLPDDLILTWTSDQDGTFATSTPDSSGAVAFSTDDLSPAVHAITATVTDRDGLATSRLFNIEITDCGLIWWYRDLDGDGFGDSAQRYDGCTPPSGYIRQDGDCDDSVAAVNPGASERCSTAGVDDDCDGLIDEADAVDAPVYYADLDGDGYGDPTSAAGSCTPPSGRVTRTGDCDDSASDVNPGEDEICGDAIDEDCDGLAPSCQVPVSLADADARFYGVSAGDEAGTAVLGAGDVDGDGYGDLVIGAPGDDDGGTDAGAANLFLGPILGDHSLSTADAILLGARSSDRGGRAMAALGDVDGDGLDDVLVGAATECSSSTTGSSTPGEAWLLLGPLASGGGASQAHALITGQANGDKAGIAVARAGDVDGDGTIDLLVGACGEDSGGSSAGMAYLLLGPISGSVGLSSADARLIGERSADLAGSAVAGAGDFDGDGHDDLIIGAYAEDTGGNAAGSAYLAYGPVVGDLDLAYADLQLVGVAAQDFAGRSVAGVGDTDGDGTDDLLVGASGNDDNGTSAGAAYLLLGSSSPRTGSLSLSGADATFLGESTLAYAGRSVQSAGDLDGDGLPDLLIGAHGDDGAGTAAGAAYLAFSPSSGTIPLDEPQYKLLGEAAGDEAGFAVAPAGDIDGDGAPDLLVGAYKEPSYGLQAGAAYLILNASLP